MDIAETLGRNDGNVPGDVQRLKASVAYVSQYAIRRFQGVQNVRVISVRRATTREAIAHEKYLK